MGAAAAPPAAGDARPAPGTPGRPFDPLTSWRTHWRKAAAVAAAVVALGLPVVVVKGRPVYYAEAALRISPTYVGNLQDQGDVQLASTTQYGQFVQQQLTIVRSYDVALEALRRLGDQRALWQRPDEPDRRAAERLMATISARPVRDTYLITIGLEAHDPAGLAEIVNAVAGAYVDRAVEEGLYGTETRVRQLEARRDALQRQIDAHVARLSAIAQELGVSTFEESSLNPHDTALLATTQALDDWRRRSLAAEARLEALRAAQARELALELDSQVRAELEKDPAVLAVTKHYWERRAALLDQASGLAPDHPATRSIRRQLADLDAELERTTTAAAAAIRQYLDQRRRTRAAEELSRAEAEAEQAREVVRQLEAVRARQQEQVRDYAARYQTALDLVTEIRRARKRVETINNRIDFFVLESQAPGFVRIVSPARPPLQPISGGRRFLLLLVVGAACGLAAVLPVALDRFDPRIRVPADVERALGVPPLGWVAERSSAAAAALATEQVRRLALAIDRERRRHGTTCLALTGVHAGSGTSTLALDLARELALQGIRSVAVDADPTGRDTRYEARGRTPTLVDVLAGTAVPAEAVVAADDGGPDRVPLGPAPEGALLARRTRLADALGALAQRYDLVLVDAAPVLDAAEAELLVGLADGAVLVVGAASVGPADLKRAGRVLERLAPPVVGVVLTRVRVEALGGPYLAALPGQPAAPAVPDPVTLVTRWLWA